MAGHASSEVLIQPNFEAVPAKKRVEDSFNRDFRKLWIGAGLLSAISGEHKVILETYFGRKIPCPKTLASVYADWGYDDLPQQF